MRIDDDEILRLEEFIGRWESGPDVEMAQTKLEELKTLKEATLLSVIDTPETREISDMANEFDKVMQPVMSWLRENYSPHTTIIATPHTAELLEGNLSCMTNS